MAFPGEGTRPESIFVDDTRSVVGAEVACVPGSNRNPSDLTRCILRGLRARRPNGIKLAMKLSNPIN